MSLRQRVLVVVAGILAFLVSGLFVSSLLHDGAVVPGPGVESDLASRAEGGNNELVQFAGEGFTISLPEQPEHTRQRLKTQAGPVSADLYFASDHENMVGVAVSPYPNGVVDLDGAVKGSAKAVSGQVLSSERTAYRGYPSRQFRLRARMGGTLTTVFGRAVAVDGTLFQVQYVLVGVESDTAPELYTQVADSLRFE